MLDFAAFKDHVYTIRDNREQSRLILKHIQTIERGKFDDLLKITDYEFVPQGKGRKPDDRIIQAIQRAEDKREHWTAMLDKLPAEDPAVLAALDSLKSVNGIMLHLFVFSEKKVPQIASEFNYERTSIYDKVNAGIKEAYKLYCERMKADTDSSLTERPEAAKSA